MKNMLESFPLAVKMILKDPVNLVLSLFPTMMALALYLLTVVSIYRNSDRLVAMLRGYIYSPEQATLAAKFLTAILIIFVFVLMSWTFVIVVGIIAAPFNSMLSARIERKLKGLPEEKKEGLGLAKTFLNELKKLIFVAVVAVFALLLNLFPLFYPLGIFLVALLFSVQFLDYSWSRHGIPFRTCLVEVGKNIVPYALSGFFFLLLVTVPIMNAFVPALATGYYTVLWNKK